MPACAPALDFAQNGDPQENMRMNRSAPRALTRAGRRAAAALALLWLGTVTLAPWCQADTASNFPQQPVRIELPYGPGGVADISARIVAQRMSELLGQQVIIENRPSAAQSVASEITARAAPDGYTLLLLNQGHAVSVSLYKSLSYDPVRDFAPISTIGFFGLVLAVDTDSPYHSVAELIAAARRQPGRLNLGAASIGSTQFIAAELFRSLAGIDIQTVPFKTTPSIITALKSHDIDAMMEMLAPMIPQVRSGSLRGLGVTFNHRYAGLPDVPSLAEAGVQNYEASAWNALAAPAQTPRPVIDRLNQAVRDTLADPTVAKRLLDLGIDARPTSPEQLQQLLATEIVRWRSVIEHAHIERQ
jgi:tripartite-type tricarboxylate transporter receptor subunit TctC